MTPSGSTGAPTILFIFRRTPVWPYQHTNHTTTHLSYGGGGGGGGASAFSDDPNPGGKGGSGGGLVYLQVGKLVLQGTISVKGMNQKSIKPTPPLQSLNPLAPRSD